MRTPRLQGLRPIHKWRKPQRAGTKAGRYGVPEAIREDKYRASRLKRPSPWQKRKLQKAAIRLSERLSYHDTAPETLASAAFFYEKREAILDHLVRIASKKFKGQLWFGTLLPRRPGLAYLSDFDAKLFLERLRKDFERVGARKVQGFVFAQAHGEYDTGRYLWDPHYHIVVAGAEMLAIVNGLRDTGKYQFAPSEFEDGLRAKQKHAVQLKPIKPDELRYALSYVLQTWWPARWTGEGRDGREVRSRRRRRLPDEQLVEFLLWLDKQPINHLFLLFGLEVRGGKLRLSRRGKKYVDR